MGRKCIAALFLFLISLPLAINAAQGPDTVVVDNAQNVDDVVARISSVLEKQGFEIVLVVNHSASADGVGLNLAPTQVIFARMPRIAEKVLLNKGWTVGIDLPVKFLVFKEEGIIRLAVNSIGYLIDRHDLRLHDFLLGLLDSALEQFGKADNGLVTVQSARSREDTVQGLKDAIAANDAFRIPLVLDYADRRSLGKYNQHGKLKAPVLIVFGNPNAGTPLMQVDQRVGIDLPQKFLVWEDKKGNVNITYNDPFFIAGRHDIVGQDARLEAISNALRTFALTGAGLN